MMNRTELRKEKIRSLPDTRTVGCLSTGEPFQVLG